MALRRIITALIALTVLIVLAPESAFPTDAFAVPAAAHGDEPTLVMSASTGEPALAETTAPPEGPVVLRIERIEARLPDIKVYLYAENAGDITPENVKASLDGKALAVEDIKPFRDSGEGITYIFLADVSTSITNTQMNSMKDALLGFSENLNGKDSMALISFGVRVEPLLGGGEDRAAREKAVDLLVNDQGGTAFYDAINKAIQIANSIPDPLPKRAVAIAISDGEDYNDGGFTKNEIDSALSDGSLPLFALGLSEGNTGNNTSLDDFCETARKSGGGYNVTGAEGVGNALSETVDVIEDCYVLYLKSDSNVIDNTKQTLVIDINVKGSSVTAEKETWIRDWEPDNIPPEVLGIEQLDGQNGIRIEFSKPLAGAGNPASYVISDMDMTPVAIQNVAYAASDDLVFTDVIFAETLYSGEYTLSFIGITDDTMEENPLEGIKTFYFEGEAASLRSYRAFIENYWWTICIAAAVVILLIVFRAIRKRKGLIKVNGKLSFGDAAEFKHRFKTPETFPASLVVTDMKGNAYKVDIEINKSFFVGRSGINNLSFDDAKMSRQHFAVEVEQGEYFIIDLHTTNGTFLNGVRVSGKRKLENNDVITAGNEKFVFKAGAGV